jgi:hypothetical protein
MSSGRLQHMAEQVVAILLGRSATAKVPAQHRDDAGLAAYRTGTAPHRRPGVRPGPRQDDDRLRRPDLLLPRCRHDDNHYQDRHDHNRDVDVCDNSIHLGRSVLEHERDRCGDNDGDEARTRPAERHPPGHQAHSGLNPKVRQKTIKKTICKSGWTKKIRPPVSYTNALKIKQMVQYGETGTPSDYEEDHFIPLELGGRQRTRRTSGLSRAASRSSRIRSKISSSGGCASIS